MGIINPLFALFAYWYEAGAPTTVKDVANAAAVHLAPAVHQSTGMVEFIAAIRHYANLLVPLVVFDTLFACGIVALTIWLLGRLIMRCAGLGFTCLIMVAILLAVAVSVWALITLIIVTRREEAVAAPVEPPDEPGFLSTAYDVLARWNPMQ
jgi:hypothetical protein